MPAHNIKNEPLKGRKLSRFTTKLTGLQAVYIDSRDQFSVITSDHGLQPSRPVRGKLLGVVLENEALTAIFASCDDSEVLYKE